jgi:prepilin-type N-terminal cleavage/methylation domain-containing protein
MSRRGVSRCGMTLLELIVGLTITGMALSAGYGALASILDHRAAADARIDGLSRSAAHRRTLLSWLEGARLVVDQDGPPFRGLDGTWRHLPDDELSFLTTAETPLGAAESVVRLYIDRDTLTPERGLTAELSAWRSLTRERVEIEPRAAGLDLQFATQMLGRDEWLPSWISSTVLPAGVEVRLSAEEGDTLPALLRLPLTAPIGGGR